MPKATLKSGIIGSFATLQTRSRTQPGCAPQAGGTEDQGAKGCCDEGLCRSHGVPPTFLGLDLGETPVVQVLANLSH